jgi:hypothetical protein
MTNKDVPHRGMWEGKGGYKCCYNYLIFVISQYFKFCNELSMSYFSDSK